MNVKIKIDSWGAVILKKLRLEANFYFLFPNELKYSANDN